MITWRSTIVKTALRNSNFEMSRFLNEKAKMIWETLSNFWPANVSKKTTKAAFESLFMICQQAYELALLFRSSKIEYEWQQNPKTFLKHSVEILGTEGVPTHMPYRINRIVFGGVLRGDRTTGKLADCATQILKPSVIITKA
jgi:hypothetical protein